MAALDFASLDPASYTPEYVAQRSGYTLHENDDGMPYWTDSEGNRVKLSDEGGGPGAVAQLPNLLNQDLGSLGYAPLNGDLNYLARTAQYGEQQGFGGNPQAYLDYVYGPGSSIVNDQRFQTPLVKAGDPTKALNPTPVALPNTSGGLFKDFILPSVGMAASVYGAGTGLSNLLGLDAAGGAGALGSDATWGVNPQSGGASVDMMSDFGGSGPDWLTGGGGGGGEFGGFDLSGGGSLGGLDWSGFNTNATPFMSDAGSINPAWFGDGGSGVVSGFGDLWNIVNSPIGKTLTGALGGGAAGGVGKLLGGMSPLDALLTYLSIQDQKSIDRTPSTSTTSVTRSPFMQQAGQDLINTGKQVGPLNPNTYQPYLDKASGYLDKAAGGIPGTDLNAYMNPYLDKILNPMRERFNIDTAGKINALDSNAAMHNAFGTKRADLLKSYTQGEADRTWNSTEAGIRGDAFNSALGAASNDLNRNASVGGQYGNLGATSGALSMQGSLLPITAQSAALRTALPTGDMTTNTTSLGRPNSSFATGVGTLATLGKLNSVI